MVVCEMVSAGGVGLERWETWGGGEQGTSTLRVDGYCLSILGKCVGAVKLVSEVLGIKLACCLGMILG